MIINTGMRTDIPAFYSQWFVNRLKAGEVMVRNPYNPGLITRYVLNPDVVDLIGFCTKNPEPMLPHLSLLSPYGQYWFVTITPYGREVEPNVPGKDRVIETFQRLSEYVGTDCIGWRYDPIFLSETYPMERHLRAFEYIAAKLEGYTRTAVISFIDLYEKTRRNFSEVHAPGKEESIELGKAFIQIAGEHGMTVKPCGEGTALAEYGADCSGCMTQEVIEKALGWPLKVPKRAPAREGCRCLLSGDIGTYNTCSHLCRYCYANYDAETVRANARNHDPESPLLIGHVLPGDIIHQAEQVSWKDPQLRMDFLQPD